VHDLKDIRKNPEKYRESQRKRGQDPKVIDDLLLIDAEHRAYITIDQELQGKLNKLTAEYGKGKRDGATANELLLLECDMELAKIEAGIAKSDVRIKYLDEQMWAMLGGREFAEQIIDEIDKQTPEKPAT